MEPCTWVWQLLQLPATAAGVFDPELAALAVQATAGASTSRDAAVALRYNREQFAAMARTLDQGESVLLLSTCPAPCSAISVRRSFFRTLRQAVTPLKRSMSVIGCVGEG